MICTVTDVQGGVLKDARVHLASPALIGGAIIRTVNDKGQLRFPALPPGSYSIDIVLNGFASVHEADIQIGAGQRFERHAILQIAGVAESIVVEGSGSRIEARDPGLGSRFSFGDIRTIPSRRASMFDFLRAAPGVSPTSPSNPSVNTVSVFGSGTNENQFLFDGTNFTCPCNGAARAEPSLDFIQEIQTQSAGASAEYGNLQGAVVNVVTRQGGERLRFDASYYGQTAALTSQPVRLNVPGTSELQSGYERERYRDATGSAGGPVAPQRLWFFTGYQYLRDHDSQPGADPAFPRKYQQDKFLGKLTWRLGPRWRLVQSFHNETWISPEPATPVKRIEATVRRSADVRAMTFGHLTHSGANTVWDVRLGRFEYLQREDVSTGDRSRSGRVDIVTGTFSNAPPALGELTLGRLTAKAAVSHHIGALLGGDHEWRIGAQVENGGHHAAVTIPGGRRFIDAAGAPIEVVSSPAANIGGMAVTASGFATDSITFADRLTVNLGVRFDHSRAVSQDLHALDAEGRELDEIVPGGGTLYTWNVWSPRTGLTAKLTGDGRTMLRASYGRFSQGVLTGEIQTFHPGAQPTTFTAYSPQTGSYSGFTRVMDPRTSRLDPAIRAPHSDEFSIGADRAIARTISVAIAYVRKDGRDFIGWTDAGGEYVNESRTLADGTSIPVFTLVNGVQSRQLLLTNPDGYSLTYNGVVAVIEKRRSRGWQAFASYTLSRASGLQPSSGTDAAGAQSSTVAPPTGGTMFGDDPNDLTNARGRLPNDRPHMLRMMGSVEIPRTRMVLAGNLQRFSGKPWAAATVVNLGAQGASQRILLEPRGARRLSAQTLLDVRLSRPFSLRHAGRVEVMIDLLNLLNDTAEEGLATDVLTTVSVKRNAGFGEPNVFIDPRRAMVSVRWSLGR